MGMNSVGGAGGHGACEAFWNTSALLGGSNMQFVNNAAANNNGSMPLANTWREWREQIR